MPPGEPLSLSLVLSEDLVKAHSELSAALTELNTSHQIDSAAPVPLSALWVQTAGADHVQPQLIVVWRAAMMMDRVRGGTILETLQRAQAATHRITPPPTLSLILLNSARSPPGLEHAAGWLALELGVSVRAIKQVELGTVLVSLGAMFLKSNSQQLAPSASKADFLQGLRAKDVLFNKAASVTLSDAWGGALRQLLSENAANAVFQKFPTYRSLYHHLCTATDPECTIADLRVGQKRLGDVRARRLRRVMTATNEQRNYPV